MGTMVKGQDHEIYGKVKKVTYHQVTYHNCGEEERHANFRGHPHAVPHGL
jgi:hypothetical protein